MALLFRLGGGVVVLLVLLIIVGLGWQTAPLLKPARLAPATDVGRAASIVAVGREPRGQRSWYLTGLGALASDGEAAAACLDVPGSIYDADHECFGLKTVLIVKGCVVVGLVSV